MNIQDGLSPKVIAAAITGIVVYAITKLGVQLDPVLEQAINVAAMILAGYLAPPGTVKERPIGTPSDEALGADVAARLNRE